MSNGSEMEGDDPELAAFRAQYRAREIEILRKQRDALRIEIYWRTFNAGIDIAGIWDPTPLTDAWGMGVSLGEGDWWGAAASGISMVPFIGDALGKEWKMARTARIIEKLHRRLEVVEAAYDAYSRLSDYGELAQMGLELDAKNKELDDAENATAIVTKAEDAAKPRDTAVTPCPKPRRKKPRKPKKRDRKKSGAASATTPPTAPPTTATTPTARSAPEISIQRTNPETGVPLSSDAPPSQSASFSQRDDIAGNRHITEFSYTRQQDGQVNIYQAQIILNRSNGGIEFRSQTSTYRTDGRPLSTISP